MTGTQVKPTAPALAFDTSDERFVRHPYDRYSELRESTHLHRTVEGMWVLTRHADVVAALRDTRLSSNPRHVDRARRGGAPAGLPANLGIDLMLTCPGPSHHPDGHGAPGGERHPARAG